jgi:glucosylceramidase
MKSKQAEFTIHTVIVALAMWALSSPAQEKAGATLWLTKANKTALFARQGTNLLWNTKVASDDPVIEVDESQTFQAIDGFGFALTGGSAMLLEQMNATNRAAILKELFGTETNDIGISYLRLSIGASDLNAKVFTYDDLPAGASDLEMAHFSLGPDRADVIPVLKEILAVTPQIKILGSPWSAPSWMKTNERPKGGQLKPECYSAYAKYFVNYIYSMKGTNGGWVALEADPRYWRADPAAGDWGYPQLEPQCALVEPGRRSQQQSAYE